MVVRRYLYIFKAPGFKGEKAVLDSNVFRAEVLAVASIEEGVEIVSEYIGEVDLIELCGSFGKNGAEAISKAVKGTIPVAYICSTIPQTETGS